MNQDILEYDELRHKKFPYIISEIFAIENNALLEFLFLHHRGESQNSLANNSYERLVTSFPTSIDHHRRRYPPRVPARGSPRGRAGQPRNHHFRHLKYPPLLRQSSTSHPSNRAAAAPSTMPCARTLPPSSSNFWRPKPSTQPPWAITRKFSPRSSNAMSPT